VNWISKWKLPKLFCWSWSGEPSKTLRYDQVMPKSRDRRKSIRERELLIEDQIEAAWTRLLAREGLDFKHRPIDLMRPSRERTAVQAAERYLQPWLRLFQEQIAWLGAYNLLWRMKHDSDSISRADRLPFELLSTVVNNAAAVHRLVRSGFDYQAKSMLRVMIESAYLSLALLADRNLRIGFIAAVEPEDARRFWRQRLGGRHIAAILARVESQLEIDFHSQSDLAEWRQATSEWLSQFVHPNYLTAVIGGYAWDPRNDSLDLLRPNTFGRCCAGSRSTLAKAFRMLWYFCAFFYSVAHTGLNGAPRFSPDAKDDVESAMVVLGYDIVLAAGNRWWEVDEEEGYEEPPDDE